MTVSAYTFVDMYIHALKGAHHLLVRGGEHALAKGVAEADFLDWRLAEDMRPLSFQVMVICNFSQQWPARFADLPAPADVAADLSLEGYKSAIQEAIAYLEALRPDQFKGRDDVDLTIQIGPEGGLKPTLPASRWLSIFATTNLYFHVSTLYGILRTKGVPIGKMDLFAGGL